MSGITNFSAYIAHLMDENLKKEKIFQKYTPRFELISISNPDVIILKDNHIDKIIEIKIINGITDLDCTFCQSPSCVHIGFCYSLHQLYG